MLPRLKKAPGVRTIAKKYDMGTSSKQVMDIKVTKGLASVGNEELRDWTEKGWNQAMREGNYDRSREHLNFEIRPGGMVAPIDNSRPLTRRMAIISFLCTAFLGICLGAGFVYIVDFQNIITDFAHNIHKIITCKNNEYI